MSVSVRCAIWLCGVAAFGAERWAVPVLGYVFEEETKAIYPVSGVPGAASLGSAIPIPVKVDRASVAWGGRPCAVISALDGTTSLAVWSQSGVGLTPMPGAVAWTEAAWSGGPSFALYNRTTGQIQVWNMPAPQPESFRAATAREPICQHPEVSTEMEVAGVTTVAAAPNGSIAAATSVEVVIREGETTTRIPLVGVRALTFTDAGLLAVSDQGTFSIRGGQAEAREHAGVEGRPQGVSPEGALVVSCANGRIAAGHKHGSPCGDEVRWLRTDLFVIRTSEGDLWLNGVDTSVLLSTGGAK